VTAARPLNPGDIAQPVGLYSQGMLTSGAGRTLHVSGQVGLRPDGQLAGGFEAQAQAAWNNVVAVLAAAGMGPGDLMKVTTYLTDPAHLPLFAPVRARFLGDARPASTLVIVRALARPEWLVEVEAIAWRGDEGDAGP
jgi:enamine deaminase RidA (YjgF/YER057c/UK114 family)